MRTAVFLLGLTLTACTATQSQNPKEVRSIIERDNAKADQWYAAGEIDSVASMFAVDAWQMSPNNPPLVGREAIRQFWSQAVKWGKWDFTLTTQDVSVSDSIAVERGKYLLKLVAGSAAPPGMGSLEDHGNYVVYWRRDPDNEWRAVWDAPISEVPLPVPEHKQ
ncbi:MAG: nuclear transport factor 2 family protein [Gemmatimonadaceae bacterium]